MKIQQYLISYLLNPISAIMGRMKQKTKDYLWCTSCASLIIMYFINAFFNSSPIIHWRFIFQFVIDGALLGIMFLCTIPSKMKPVQIDWRLWFPYLGYGIFVLIAGLTKSIDYLAEAFLYLIIFPALYFIYNQVDSKKYLCMSLSIVRITFTIFFVYHMLFYPITHRKYEGVFYNTNGLAFYIVVVIICSFVEIFTLNFNVKKKFQSVACFGIASSLLYYTNSRTGLLAATLSLFFAIILVCMVNINDLKRVVLNQLAPMVLCVIICIPGVLYLSYWVTDALTTLENISNINHSQNINTLAPEPIVEDKIGQDSTEVLSEINSVNQEESIIEDFDIENNSSGRIESSYSINFELLH